MKEEDRAAPLLTREEYYDTGNLFNDYRETDDDLAVTCDYEFLRTLQVGDVIQIAEDFESPWVQGIQLDEGDWYRKLLRVTRKIYSPTSLDVYVVETDDSY